MNHPLLSKAAWTSLRTWYRLHGRHELPWRNQRTPWRVLVAETLLHRTRADIAASIYPKLVQQFPGPRAILQRPSVWRDLLAPAGLAWRVEAFVECCKQLAARHGGQVPSERKALMALPGVGHYGAQAVLCFGYGQRASLVDTNTIRLAGRISGQAVLASAHRTRRVQELVARLGDGGCAPDASDNFALLDLAALICLPATPRCRCCPIECFCETGRAGTGAGTNPPA